MLVDFFYRFFIYPSKFIGGGGGDSILKDNVLKQFIVLDVFSIGTYHLR